MRDPAPSFTHYLTTYLSKKYYKLKTYYKLKVTPKNALFFPIKMEKQKFAQKNTNSFKKLHTIRTNNMSQKK